MKKRKTKDGRVLPDGVSERADGRFLYRYVVHGKSHYLYDRDLNQLKKKIAQKQMDLARGSFIGSEKLTLHEWFPQYVELYKKNKIKESTLANYINYYKWYIKGEVIDQMPIREVRHSHMVAHFQYLAEKRNLSEGTLKALASILYNCLEQCLYDGIISLNPVSNVMRNVVATPKGKREALTVEETKLMIDFLKREGEWQTVYLSVIGVGLSTGLRFGELIGLTWKDIDFRNRIIDVNHSMNYRIRGSGTKHEFFVTTPKTRYAIRQIPMTEKVVELLQRQKVYQREMGIPQDIEIDGYSQFVFTTKKGYPFTNEGLGLSLYKIIKQANEWEAKRAEEEGREAIILPVHTPHVWRHTFCTRLVESEIRYEELKVLMGHSSIKTTIDVYTHIKQANQKVYSKLEGIVGGL